MAAKATAPAETGGHEVPERGAHPAREQSVAAGKAARQLAPLASHRDFSPAASRDPIGLLLHQAGSRVPELVPVRHGRMLVSPFTYYRGAALPMAADVAGMRSSGLRAQLCGDAHLLNFGAFASPERRLVFDLNDFDETLPGPFEWDVKRLVASMAAAGRDNGLTAGKRHRVARDLPMPRPLRLLSPPVPPLLRHHHASRPPSSRAGPNQSSSSSHSGVR